MRELAGHRPGGRPVGPDGEEPAWLRSTAVENRVSSGVAVLAVIGLQLVLPDRLVLGSTYLLPSVEVVLLVAFVVLLLADPRRHRTVTAVRHDRLDARIRTAGLALTAVASAANAWSVAALVHGLLRGTGGDAAGPLLADGSAIWAANVLVFALWYWEFDRRGPVSRARGTVRFPDLLFPQLASPGIARPDWEPRFPDYLYVSFTNATAFSPTDTPPLTRWAKAAFTAQSVVSLVTVALVIARSVNVLH